MRRGAVALLVTTALVLAACTDGEPAPPAPTSSAPTTGPEDDDTSAPQDEADVAFVLPAEDEVQRDLASYERAIDRARASFRGQLADLREVHLDGASFRRDVLTLLGDEGTALTCSFGAGARDVVAAAAELPGQRFCVVDDRIDETPANVLAVWFRYEEAAYLLGFAAARMLGEGTGGTLGVITPSLDTRSERERLAFTAGARSARAEVIIEVETLTDDEEGTVEERAAAAAERLYDDAEAGVVLLTAGVPAEPVLQEAQERLRLVTGLGPPLSEGVPAGLEPFVLATAHARLERGLVLAIARLLDGWSGGVVTVGFADDGLVLSPGASVRWNEVREEVAALRGRIERGEVVPA